MANSNVMDRTDADKNHVGASMLVLDSVGDVGKIVINGRRVAMINFDGTTTPPNIRSSINVSSITDLGTGLYVINFETPIVDDNYLVITTINRTYGNSESPYGMMSYPYSRTVNSVSIVVQWTDATKYDMECISVEVLR